VTEEEVQSLAPSTLPAHLENKSLSLFSKVQQQEISLSTLLQYPKSPKNARFRNVSDHLYSLRSRWKPQGTNFKSRAVVVLVAQHLYELFFIPPYTISTLLMVTRKQIVTFVLDLRPLKIEPWRVRITVGGDRLTYTLDARSPAANMMETKFLLNSVILDAKKGAKFMTADLKDHCLNTPTDACTAKLREASTA